MGSMDIFVGLAVIAFALYMGLSEIAGAIRNRRVDIRFSGPVDINHRSD